MTDPTTTNVGLAIPTRGSDAGTWDTPLNSDFIALDGFFGGVQTISVTSSPVTLTSPSSFTPTPSGGPTQAQNAVLRFTGTLSTNVTVTLPLPGFYIVENLTQTSGGGLFFRATGTGEIISTAQPSCQHIYNDGTNVRFVNLPPVGSYMDLCAASVPSWISGCTKAPYLICDGSTFSGTTFPYLASLLGGTTLPDFRGRGAFYLNGGTGRITSAINGDVILSSGGDQNLQAHAHSGTTGNDSPDHTHTTNGGAGYYVGGTYAVGGLGGGQGVFVAGATFISATSSGASIRHQHPFTTSTVGTGSGQNMPPGIIAGIRLIRAG